MKNIALSGYDNAKYLAPDETYSKLPGCCKYERTLKITAAKTDQHKIDMKHDDHSGHDHNAMDKKPVISSTGTHNDHSESHTKDKQEESQLQKLVQNYFMIKDALVKSDAKTVAAKAAAFESAIGAIKMESLKPEQHNAWMKIEKDLKKNAYLISKANDIKIQRQYFSDFSESMYIITKAVKSNETLYWQNCPMYNNGVGANWLSKESAVKNPYYGSMMLTCGKTIETIK